LCQFGAFFPVLVYCTKKNLATLLGSMEQWRFLAENHGFLVGKPMEQREKVMAILKQSFARPCKQIRDKYFMYILW
jgi:hypothetical protein